MVKRVVFFGFSLLIALPPLLQGQHPSLAAQVASAVLPLPMGLRSGAGVLGSSHQGEREQLRESQNGMVCAADDPADDQFDVRCYHEDFWVVIRRARFLRRRAPTPEAGIERLTQQLMDGTLPLPSAPTAGYRMLGPISAFDSESNLAGPEIRKWQSIHFPFKTAEEMGLPEEIEENMPGTMQGVMPWVMASGSWWSHVMITHGPRR